MRKHLLTATTVLALAVVPSVARAADPPVAAPPPSGPPSNPGGLYDQPAQVIIDFLKAQGIITDGAVGQAARDAIVNPAHDAAFEGGLTPPEVLNSPNARPLNTAESRILFPDEVPGRQVARHEVEHAFEHRTNPRTYEENRGAREEVRVLDRQLSPEQQKKMQYTDEERASLERYRRQSQTDLLFEDLQRNIDRGAYDQQGFEGRRGPGTEGRGGYEGRGGFEGRGAEPSLGGDPTGTIMLGLAAVQLAQGWVDRGQVNTGEALTFGGVTYGAVRVPALGHALGAAFLADVAVNSYGKNGGNLLNALLNPNDPALRAAVQSGQLQADDFVPGLRGNPAWDVYSWFYDHANSQFFGAPLPARYHHPPPPPRDEWKDFVNGLKCLGTQGCVGRALGLNFGSSWGDPHITTGDGLHYDFQAAGEFVFVEADGVLVHVRQEPRGSTQVAFNTAIAARIGSHRVGVYALPTPHVTVDGQPMTESFSLGADGDVTISPSMVVLQWAAGDRFEARLAGDHLDLTPGMSDAQRGRTRGLYGSLDGDRTNDLALPTGEVLPQPLLFATLYGPFANGWRIRQEDSLFDYAPGESTATFTNTSFPPAHVSTTSLSDAARQSAMSACLAAGVTDPILLDSCVLDVGLTGDTSLAAGATAVPPPAERTVEEAVPQGVPTETFKGHVYAFVTARRNRADATAYCAQNGMHLASVGDAEENEFLSLRSRTYAGGEWLTGGRYDAATQTFLWSDATSTGYTNWHPGEPNNTNTGSEDCIVLNRFSPDTTWNDNSCTASWPFICEVTP